MSLRILSYNIHKGFAPGNLSLVTDAMKTSVHAIKPDLVFLQEVVGQNDFWKIKHQNWPALPQHEFFCGHDILYNSYGKNAHHTNGHHGNAILSRHPFGFEINIDVSFHRFAQRGFLHTKLDPAFHPLPLHAICIHFGLFAKERQHQSSELCKYIKQNIPPNDPLIIAGDTNDWQQILTPYFLKEAALKECFWEFYGSHPRTFPSWYPIACLDRIYYRNLRLKSCEHLSGKPWSRLSDHLPVIADFEFME